jgi:hypothetical protein
VREVFFAPHYKDYTQSSTDIIANESNLSTPAFVAISYFGVEKFESDSATLISQERLKEHLAALELNGYTTVFPAGHPELLCVQRVDARTRSVPAL